MESRHGNDRCRHTLAALALSVLAALAALAAAMAAAFPPSSQAAPTRHGGGWVPTPPGDYRKYEAVTIARQYWAAVDLSSQLPPVGNQGLQNCCAAWSVGYYYKTWQEKQEHPGWNLNQGKYQYSPAFIYNQREDQTGDNGMSFEDAFTILQNKGCTDLVQMPYSESDYSTQPGTDDLNAALPYRIADGWSYFFMRTSEPPPEGFAIPNDITPLKQHLDAGEPFVIGSMIYSDFPDDQGNPPVLFTTRHRPRPPVTAMP